MPELGSDLTYAVHGGLAIYLHPCHDQLVRRLSGQLLLTDSRVSIMKGIKMPQSVFLGFAPTKRLLLGFAGALTAVTLLFSVTSSKARAGDFCGTAGSPVWVNPYGSGGDKCWGTAHYQLDWAAVRTYERAGCVTIAEGTTLLTSWVCGAAGSAPEYAAEASKFNGEHYYKGVVRNNNLSNGTYISGLNACLGGTC